jgi:hypothetical protein
MVLALPDDIVRIFIVAQGDELGVPQVIGASPLQELDLCDGFRTKPNTFPHLLGCEPLTPSAGANFGEIDERTLLRLKMSDLL